ncbi:MAG: hypothetical protein ABEJ92_03565 [Halobacteriales archaeon]
MTDAEAAGTGGYAGSNVFLAAVDPDRFASTLASPVDLDDLPERPAALADRASARVGPVPAGDRNEQMFERMAPGDLVLCYADGEYLGLGRVAATFEAGGAADALWDGADVAGGYVLEDFAAVSVPARAVNSLFDYAPDYAPGGLIRVADGRVGSPLAAIREAVERYSEQRA